MNKSKHIEIYTDGACRGNPGVGGWGVLLKHNDHEKILSGAESHTTNNRMELMAAIMALQALRESCIVDLYTDSQYVQKGISLWLVKWKAQNWQRADKQPVKNVDLWQALDKEAARHQVTWHWVRGHNNHPGNEEADRIANVAIDEFLKNV